MEKIFDSPDLELLNRVKVSLNKEILLQKYNNEGMYIVNLFLKSV